MSTRGRVGASLNGDFVQTALCCLAIVRELFPLLPFTQQKCFLLLEIPLPTLFSLLLFLQVTGISSSLHGVCPKATPYRH